MPNRTSRTSSCSSAAGRCRSGSRRSSSCSSSCARWRRPTGGYGSTASARSPRAAWAARWCRRRARARASRRRRPPGSRLARYFGPFALGLLVLFPLISLGLLGPASSLKWINNYGIQIMIYVMLGWGLNIVVGLAGLLDLGYAAFYAVGAYSYALLSTTFGLSFWICLPLAGMLAAMWGIILGFPVLRLSGDYLAIVTLAFGEIIRHRPHQLGRLDQRLCRHHRHSACFVLRHSVQRRGQRIRGDLSSPLHADLPHDLSILFDPRARALDQFRDDAAAPAADRAGLGSVARR